MAEQPLALRSARVFAPGMTCVHEQLLEGLFELPWIVGRFRNDWEGAPNRMELRGDPADLATRVLTGDLGATAHLFVEGEELLRRHGPRLHFDTLAIESRWLLYEASLLSIADWDRFERGLEGHLDKDVIFFDVGYGHLGNLSDLSLVRPCTREDLERWHRRNTLKMKLLSVLARFRTLTFVDVTAMAAYLGYRTSCLDQIEHYAVPFREQFREVFQRDMAGEVARTNAAVHTRLMGRIRNRRVDLEWAGGLESPVAPGGLMLSLRVILHADDPLLCPIQFLVAWTSHVALDMDWRNFVVRDGGFEFIAGMRPDLLVDHVHKLVNLKTQGQFSIKVTE